MYTVTSADPDPNPRGGGQLPNPNECNSTLRSGTNNIYPYPYIDVNDRGHRLRITHTQWRRSVVARNIVLENLEKSGNLKKTSESQGICDRIPKVRELLSEIHFQPS